ncbi:hypothetical protein C8Q76DRAFT_791154 [Earliella scabrosa]|nr:hypothetical protein C8Q76DRAFT_791154 [Earliella scabrosa]
MTRTRRRLNPQAEELRRLAYKKGQMLTKAQKDELYQQIKTLPGCAWYTRKTHSNYCKSMERDDRRMAQDVIKRYLQAKENPTVVDMVVWSLELGNLYGGDVFQLIYEMLPAQVKANAQMMFEMQHQFVNIA